MHDMVLLRKHRPCIMQDDMPTCRPATIEILIRTGFQRTLLDAIDALRKELDDLRCFLEEIKSIVELGMSHQTNELRPPRALLTFRHT